MVIRELKLPFPFYKERNRQHRFRKSCGGQILTGLLCPKDTFLPFQIRVDDHVGDLPTVSGFEIYNACLQVEGPAEVITDEGLVPITDEDGVPLTTESGILGPIAYALNTALISVIAHNSGFNLVYLGDPHLETISCGFYEAKITLSNGQIFWSEIFQVTEFPEISMPYIKMEWSNAGNLEKIVYETGYTNRMYLDTYISHSEPQYVEEVEKDGIDTETVIFAKITSRYIFSEVLPDFQMTALAAMPVAKQITIADPTNSIQEQITRVRTTQNPEATGCFSFIEVQMEVDDELYRTACD